MDVLENVIEAGQTYRDHSDGSTATVEELYATEDGSVQVRLFVSKGQYDQNTITVDFDTFYQRVSDDEIELTEEVSH